MNWIKKQHSSAENEEQISRLAGSGVAANQSFRNGPRRGARLTGQMGASLTCWLFIWIYMYSLFVCLHSQSFDLMWLIREWGASSSTQGCQRWCNEQTATYLLWVTSIEIRRISICLVGLKNCRLCRWGALFVFSVNSFSVLVVIVQWINLQFAPTIRKPPPLSSSSSSSWAVLLFMTQWNTQEGPSNLLINSNGNSVLDIIELKSDSRFQFVLGFIFGENNTEKQPN